MSVFEKKEDDFLYIAQLLDDSMRRFHWCILTNQRKVAEKGNVTQKVKYRIPAGSSGN